MGLLDYFRPIVYVTLKPDLLSVRDVRSDRVVAAPPVAAISREPKPRVLGIGEEAKAAAAGGNAELVNPFKHPRTLISDFTTAELVLKGLLKKLFEGRLFVAAPVIVLHPRVDPDGGFTQIEIRALHELAMGAGASKVVVWHGRELGKDELSRLEFASGGERLD